MKIKSLLLVLFALVIVVAGCEKKSQSTSQTPSPAPANPTAAAPEKAAPVPAEPKLVIKDKKVGKGAAVVQGDTVIVNYKGWLDDGSVFDTSKKPGREPFEFTVGAGQVIQGWDQGLVEMKVGGTRVLTIPSSLGYGETGQGIIPPDATLHFEIDLLKIKKA